MKPVLRLALCLLPLLLLNGCFGSKPKGPVEVTTKSDDDDEKELSEYELWKSGTEYYQNGLYTVAQEKFRELSNNFPVGPYSSFALLKIADADYAMKNYTEAGAEYENYARLYPSSSATAYALFQSALCFQLASRGVGRDNATLLDAEKAYQKLFSAQSGTLFEQTGRKAYRNLLKLRAKHEKFILDFYKNQGIEEAYNNRKHDYDAQWQQFSKTKD